MLYVDTQKKYIYSFSNQLTQVTAIFMTVDQVQNATQSYQLKLHTLVSSTQNYRLTVYIKWNGCLVHIL